MSTLLTPELFEKALLAAVRTRTTEIVEEEIAACVARVRNRLLSEVDRLALVLLSEYNIESRGNVLHIRVTKPKPDAKDA